MMTEEQLVFDGEKPQKENKNKKILQRVVKGVWIAFLIAIVLSPLYIISVRYNFLGLYGDLPSLKSLETPESYDLSSEVISADGVILGKYYRENRSPVDYDQLSPELIKTLLATEDFRFHEHSGIDFRGLMRVLFKSVLLQQDKGGGSTLSQQLAKNLFRTRSEKYNGALSGVPVVRTVVMKTKEWIVAVILEKSYTKEEILSMYLNTVDFGSNSFGVKVASKTFFNKPPDSLKYEEAAVLVGLLKAPTSYSPIGNPENALNRRNVVLGQLFRYKYIDKHQFDSLKTIPITLNYKVENHTQGIATYFRMVIRDELKSWAKENGYDLYEDGLRIYTTIDSRIQKYAEEALAAQMKNVQKEFDKQWNGANPWIFDNGKEIENYIENAIKRTPLYRRLVKELGDDTDSINKVLNSKKKIRIYTLNGEKDSLMSPLDSIRYYKKFLHAGMMAMDPYTGHVKAWVGGVNHKFFAYDHVMQSKRQPGSTFKPFVYAAAIDNGYSPCYEVIDAPVTYELPYQDPPTWTANNYDGKFTGEKMTIRQALSRSVNSITSFLMKKITPQVAVEYAHRIGIESQLDAVPALCLGAGGDLSLYELIGAYGTFVNEGTWTRPYFITRIEDKNGNVLKTFVPKSVEALSEETAYIMLHMLRGPLEYGKNSRSHGTAVGLHRYKFTSGLEIGAKTGTTNNSSDGWFVAMTKDLVTGSWVGGEDRAIHFRNWYYGQGSKTAMPIVGSFLDKVYGDEKLGYTKGTFKRPQSQLSVEIDCNRYNNTTTVNEDDDSPVESTFDPNDIL